MRSSTLGRHHDQPDSADGHISGLDLDAGGLLVVRDYDGASPPFRLPIPPIPITVDQHLTMGPGGTLRMVFEADAWDSTISFAPGIPVTLGGTLELAFAADVNLASQSAARSTSSIGPASIPPALRHLQPVRLGPLKPLHHRRNHAHRPSPSRTLSY